MPEDKGRAASKSDPSVAVSSKNASRSRLVVGLTTTSIST